MDMDARESAMHYDAMEVDPIRTALFKELYRIDALVRDNRAALPEKTYQAIDEAIIRALEIVRVLPSAHTI